MCALSKEVSGFILAGGHSQRLGRDKRSIPINGEPLLRRTIRVVRDCLGCLPTVVGDNLDGFELDDVSVLPDAIANKGPLGGLVSALRMCPTAWALVLAADMPYLSTPALRTLIESRQDQCDIIMLSDSDRLQPLAALYHVRTKLFWEERLDQDQLSLRDGVRLRSFRIVPVGSEDNLLFNINYPNDLDKIG